MNLLRNNLYLVILIVVTLVVAGVFLYQGSSKAAQIEEKQIKPRLEISQSLAQLVRPPRANAATIAGKEARNKLAEKELNEVKTSLVDYNHRNFKVGSLRLLDGTLRPVLPYAEGVWRKNVLALPYIQSYHSSLKEFLTKLNAITVPPDRVITREATALQTRFNRQEQARMKESAAGRATGIKRGNNTTTQITQRAYQQAADKVKLIAAKRGQIYATKDSFDIRLTDMNQSQLTGDEVWEAQLSLWVQQDIVDTLVKTNEEVQDSLKIPESKRCVINSAVKRLVRIEISGQDTHKTKTNTSGRNNATARYPMGPGGPGMGPGMAPGMGPGMMPTPTRRKKSRKNRKKREVSVKRAESLTGNTPDRMMDVVNYSFTVLISTRYLPVLEKKLIEQNFHFILNEDIENYPTIASVPLNSTGSYTEDELSYYGVDPVSKVTITGQLALLTDWVRGTYDEQTKVWTSQPLMPVSVMEKLPSAAQRKQDKKLISEKLPRPWDPDFVPATSRRGSRGKSSRGSRRSFRRTRR